jgi:hypothetical protein
MTHFPTRSRDFRRKVNTVGMKRRLRAELLEPRALLSAAPATALVAEANALVEGGQYANNNFGGMPGLYVGTSANSNSANDFNTYLKFDLSKISGTITSAVLELTPLGGVVTSSSMIDVLDTNSSWTEGTGGYNPNSTGPITWNNAPAASGTTAATVSASQLRVATPVSIDVTQLVGQPSSTNQTASFLVELLSPASTSSAPTPNPFYTPSPWVEFASREFHSGPWAKNMFLPTLLVNTTPGPAPTPPASLSVTASASAIAGGNSTTLSATVTDTNTLSYSWKLTSAPAGATGSAAPVLSSVSGQPGQETVTFNDAGQYTFQVTAIDSTGASGTASVTVTVAQSLTSIAVSPSSTTVVSGTTQTFTATGLDQFGNAMTTQPAFTWSATAAIGTIGTSTGILTPVALATGSSSVTGTVTASTSALSKSASAGVTVVAPSPLGLEDPTLAALVPTLLKGSGGTLTYSDMLQVFTAIEGEQKSTTVVSAADMHDLSTLLGDAATLGMPGYVQVLSSDVINDNNPADSHYQGASLGKLTAGSSGSLNVLTDLVNKWFLGLDLPAANAEGSYTYSSAGTYAADPLFNGGAANSASGTPAYADLHQGDLGDCYYLSALGSIAKVSPQTIENMFIPDGNGVYTVCFYTANGAADYVTVNTALPLSGKSLIYEGLGAGNSLWLPLAEKAYAEWNETGNEGNGNVNTYAAIEGGWMGNVYNQVFSVKVTAGAQNEYWTSSSNSTSSQAVALENQLIAALGSSTTAVTIGTDNFNYSSSTGLYGDHAYVALSYNASSGTFQLYNPWGVDQPNQNLTWSQLYANCDGFSDINTATTSASAAKVTSTTSTGTRPILIAGNSAAIAVAAAPTTGSTASTDTEPSAALAADASASVSHSSSSDAIYLSVGRAHVADAVNLHRESQRSMDLSADAVDSLLADGGAFPKAAWI